MKRRLEEINNRPFKNKRITFERVEKFISPIYFTDVNLYARLYPSKEQPVSFGHYAAGSKRFLALSEVVTKCFTSVKVGDTFGPSWSTHWFRLEFKVPDGWKGKETRLRWNSNSEAMVWFKGVPCQGLTGGDGQIRTDFILTEKARGGESFEVFIEMAANGMFGAGKGGMINPPDPDRMFALSMAEIAVFDRKADRIIRDLKLLLAIVKQLPDDDQRGWQALYAANDVVNCFQPESADSFSRASEILDGFFNQRNGDSQHLVHAVGHCHIDTAWLWPYDETKRKCARSWSSTIDLMRRYPDFKFACSQAQQFEWVKKYYPTIYEELKYFVKKGQFIPVGGTWVEMDGNIPSGEAFVRQFLYGQMFFKEEFDEICDVFWLPDTFGYSAQLPQIMAQCGIKNFVTQKLSWSLINKFPHSTFLWEGIDGTRCLTHFPPAESYESNAGVDDVLKSSTNNQDKGRVNDSLLLFGFGDGGGGPTEDMIENLRRLEDVDGVPRVKMSSPLDFFHKTSPVSDKLNVWAEELYLELHQGTFTTHSKVKKENRRSEFLLGFAEFAAVLAWVSSGKKEDVYPSQKLLYLWKLLLLNQFHDVLPGTSIKEVYKDFELHHREIQSGACSVMSDALEKWQQVGKTSEIKLACFNTLSWFRRSVLTFPATDLQQTHGQKYMLCELPAMSMGTPEVIKVENGVSICECANDVLLENSILTARFDKSGRLISLVLKERNREVLMSSVSGNQFALYDDIPLYWDAWDVMPYYKETRKPLHEATDFSIVEKGPVRASFKVTLKISELSCIEQVVSLDAESPYVTFDTTVDWNENRKFLRVDFPVDVHSQYASYDIQFGHVRRPTHGNTSWDWAKYEVCGHKWVDLSEFDFGVALLNDCKYGFSVTGHTMSISLLRSPKSPDDTADMGRHYFSYAIMPHAGTFQSAGVIQQAYNFNHDRSMITSSAWKDVKMQSVFQVSSSAVIIEAIKKAEHVENSIILRLYEAFGGKATTTLTSSFNVCNVARCDMLEKLQPGGQLSWDKENGCELSLHAFEIVTLLINIG